MKRLVLAAAVMAAMFAAAVGCGNGPQAAPQPAPAPPRMSFLEAEAIWKDEVQKLDDLEQEYAERHATTEKSETSSVESAVYEEEAKLFSMLNKQLVEFRKTLDSGASEDELDELSRRQKREADAQQKTLKDAKAALEQATNPDRPKYEPLQRLEEKYEPLIAAQKRKVDEAYAAKEAAKH